MRKRDGHWIHGKLNVWKLELTDSSPIGIVTLRYDTMTKIRQLHTLVRILDQRLAIVQCSSVHSRTH
ncbi:unnamed protein product [Hermetia illucens]|uniref:Uncharacterized protein n=1 Tax=Hermetia illucens TaxID=343691 RepID=A0A7R8Z2I3_HERIL|nr:unnamed protein product [Hermetia illucens]